VAESAVRGAGHPSSGRTGGVRRAVGGWQRSVGTPSWIERSDIETPKAHLGGGLQGVHRGYRVLYCGHGGYYVPRRLTAQDPMPGHWTGIRRLVVLRREGLSLETLRRSGSGAGFDWVGHGDIFEARPDAGSAHVGWFTRPRRLTRQLDAIADAADEFFKVHVDSADGR
jgi:hypothetical protein